MPAKLRRRSFVQQLRLEVVLKTDFRPVLNEAVPDVKQIFYYGDWNECIRLVSVLTPIFFYFF